MENGLDIIKGMHTFVDVVDQQFADEIERLKNIAVRLVDGFWIEHYHARATKPYDEWGVLGVRVRQFTHGFGIEWYRMEFYGSKGNRRVLSKSLRINHKYHRYTFSDCQQAKKWEITLALELEETFSHIRSQLKKLAKMRRTLKTYIQLKNNSN